MPRRIKKASVRFLSLCPKGANRLPVLYKEDKGEQGETTFDAQMLTKAADNFDEKGELLAVVYAPDLVDADGEYAPQDVIREAMHGMAKEGHQIDVRHNEQPVAKSDAFVAESFEIQKGDPRFADMKDYDGNAVDVAGGWGVLIKIESEDLRQKYRDGEWAGISMGGTYMPEITKAHDEETAVRRTMKALAKLFGINPSDTPNGEIEMTGDELTKVLKDNNETLAKSITESLANVLGKETPPADDKTPPADDKPADEAPLFKGDPLKLEDVQAHRKAVEAHNLRKSVDWNDPEAVAKYEATLAKAKSDDTDDEGGKEAPTEAERLIKEHEEEIARLRKASNQATDDGSSLSKEDRESLEAAENMKKYLRERRGETVSA